MNIQKDHAPSYTPPPLSLANPSFPVCSQCGVVHPPLKPGETCPNSKIKSADNKAVDFTQLFISIKGIVSKKIEEGADPEKLIRDMTLNIVKFVQNYGK